MRLGTDANAVAVDADDVDDFVLFAGSRKAHGRQDGRQGKNQRRFLLA
jgi:hypothetical protein